MSRRFSVDKTGAACKDCDATATPENTADFVQHHECEPNE